MDDAFFVSGVESVGNFDADFGGFGDGERACSQKLVEGLAFEKFHGDVSAAVLLLDGVNGADTRMVHGGGGTGFAKEAFGGVGIAHGGFRAGISGDATAELGVFRFIDETHARRCRVGEECDSDRLFR